MYLREQALILRQEKARIEGKAEEETLLIKRPSHNYSFRRPTALTGRHKNCYRGRRRQA